MVRPLPGGSTSSTCPASIAGLGTAVSDTWEARPTTRARMVRAALSAIVPEVRIGDE
jgi:hypothetical protein